VTPPSKAAETILPTEIRRGRFLQRISVVSADKDKERRALDLFSGTGSVTKVLQKKGFHVTIIEMNSEYSADLRVDILFGITKRNQRYNRDCGGNSTLQRIQRSQNCGISKPLVCSQYCQTVFENYPVFKPQEIMARDTKVLCWQPEH